MENLAHKPIVLVFPFDLLSHYLRCLQLADAIRDRYDIYFAHSKRYDFLIEEAGFKTFACAGIDADEVMACAHRFDFSWINDRNLACAFNSQVESIERYHPVAVLGDTAPTLKMAAEATRTTLVSLMNGYMTKYYRFVRKIAKAHPAAQFEDKLPAKVFEQLIKVGERLAFSRVHQPFKRLRRRLGLQRTKRYLDELEGDHNLICDVPMLFPQRDLPGNYHFIGPLFYCGRETENEILRFLDNGRRSILVSMGSSGAFEKLSFLNDEYFKRFNLVIAGETNGILRGDHFYQKPFVNNCAIMKKIDLLICHGGNGTIYQALSHGVPAMCATSIFEQEWNVQRVVQMKLGDSLDSISDPAQIRKKIQRWITMKNSETLRLIKSEIDLAQSKQKIATVFKHAIQQR